MFSDCCQPPIQCIEVGDNGIGLCNSMAGLVGLIILLISHLEKLNNLCRRL